MKFMNLLKNLLKSFDAVFVYTAIALIALYRAISKLTGPKCRFHPTCSSYALQTFRKDGFFVGSPKVVHRLLRCHPFNEGGYDPIK